MSVRARDNTSAVGGTARRTTAKKVKKDTAAGTRLRAGQWVFFGLSVCCLALILCNSDTAISYMGQGLTLCAKTVIPSLFPFMVLSELLVASGGGEVLGRLCETPVKRLFGISGASVCALMMGLVCGFPVGTKTAVSLCRRGLISAKELSRLICFCNIPSSAFLINAVGVSLFGSRRFGLLLYGICLLAAVLTALLLRLLSPLPDTESGTAPPVLPSGMTVFTHSVTAAATAMLYVCAYVVFFSALIGTLGHLLHKWGVDRTLTAFLFGVFELSGGVMQASAIADRTMAQLLAAALCGWSGVSVHLQILSLCDDLPAPFSFRPYIWSKLLQGVLCAVLFGIAAHLLPADWLSPTQSVATPTVSAGISEKIISIFNGAFIACLALTILMQLCHRIRKKAP